MLGRVASLALSPSHTFSKQTVDRVRILAGLGVEGDAHAGETVKHRSRVAADPTQPNLRQVHLIPGELLDELEAEGFDVFPGRLGENVLTRDLDLHALPTGTKLELGADVVLELTGLRNPCGQLNGVGPGLMKRLVYEDEAGRTIRRGGVMSIVEVGGEVARDDEIRVVLPPEPHRALERV
ncbi:MAG: MOSC domain-containing protein [Myxococcota bacterium]